MLKLIVVDDEIETRQGLIECIDWNGLGVEVAGEAVDGLQALELSKTLRPDIILTDVRMPIMNGIEYVKEIRKDLSDCKVVFMSGYTDKEYLKSAIQLKAVDYVEKPIRLEEVSKAVENAVLQCLEERSKKNENSLPAYGQNLSSARQELALQLLHRNLDTQAVKKNPAFGEDLISLNGNFICALLKFNLHKIPNLDNIIVSEKDTLLKIIEETMAPCAGGYLVALIDAKHAVLHAYGRVAETGSLLFSGLRSVQRNVNAAYRSESFVTMGVGGKVRGVENAAKSYMQARKALQSYFLTGYSSINVYSDEKQGVKTSFRDSGAAFSQALHAGDAGEAVRLLHALRTDIRRAGNCDVSRIKGIFLTLVAELSSAMKEMGPEAFREEQELVWADLLNDYTLDDMVELLSEKLRLISERLERQKGKSRKVLATMDFIKEHYMESLSVGLVSDRAGLSQTYLCQLFKKETGKTLNEYIEEVRIEKAKVLLRDTDMKLHEVAERVGYNNQTYFTTVFKKVTGINASDFRRKGRV